MTASCCWPSRESRPSRANRSTFAARSRPTAAAVPLPAAWRFRPACCARPARALVEIHGQHDDRGLLNPRGHRALLDRFGGIDTSDVARCWSHLSGLRDALDRERRTLDEAARDREWLDHAIAEIEALGAEEGEEERLASLRQEMKAAARIEDDLGALDGHFSGSDGGLSQLRQAARRLERIADAHPLFAEALAATDRATIEAAEAEQKIDEARRALAHSPAELEAAEARLFDIRGMARKHRVEADQLPDLLGATRRKARCDRPWRGTGDRARSRAC